MALCDLRDGKSACQCEADDEKLLGPRALTIPDAGRRQVAELQALGFVVLVDSDVRHLVHFRTLEEAALLVLVEILHLCGWVLMAAKLAA